MMMKMYLVALLLLFLLGEAVQAQKPYRWTKSKGEITYMNELDTVLVQDLRILDPKWKVAEILHIDSTTTTYLLYSYENNRKGAVRDVSGDLLCSFSRETEQKGFFTITNKTYLWEYNDDEKSLILKDNKGVVFSAMTNKGKPRGVTLTGFPENDSAEQALIKVFVFSEIAQRTKLRPRAYLMGIILGLTIGAIGMFITS